MLIALLVTLVIQICFTANAIWIALPADAEKVGFLVRQDYLIMNYVTFGVAIIILFLDSYLLLFHIWLIRRDTTTYKHIRMKQRRSSSRVV